jgi:hypothetical protein
VSKKCSKLPKNATKIEKLLKSRGKKRTTRTIVEAVLHPTLTRSIALRLCSAAEPS